jgi:RNA polymerase sigma-70 factor (ECF subfamily)
MSNAGSFDDFMRRIAAGDQDAATELVCRHEQDIRRVIRYRLRDPRLRGIVESMDICQSVLGSFLKRAKAGKIQLDDPVALIKYLTKMAQYKLFREMRRNPILLPLPPEGPAAPRTDPAESVDLREAMDVVRNLLTSEEWQMWVWRSQELDWKTIADRLEINTANARQRFSLALKRVRKALGLGAHGVRRPRPRSHGG